MKFSNGCWLQQEGCECFSPQQVYYSKIEQHQVTLCAPTTRITSRGDTLGGINLTLIITSPAPEVLRVQTSHFSGEAKHGPFFPLQQKKFPLDVSETDTELTVKSGSLSLTIGKENWNMTYRRNEKLLTRSCDNDLALIKTNWHGYAYDKGDRENTYIRQQLSIGVGELLYGLGERFGAFTKNGQSVDIWNCDGGTSTEQSYKNIPFYISSRGYGVFVNHPEKVSFEIGSEFVSKAGFSVEGGYLDYYLFNGPTLKEVIMRYTDLTGKPSLPAPWTFGLWLSTSFTTNYDEQTVMHFIDGMQEHGIPLSVFHFDCFWMKEFHWSSFLWDERVFPDPVGMLHRIKSRGLRVCVWINPYIAQESVLFKEGMEHDYFIKRRNGDVWQWDMWQPGMAIVDFTNRDACKWFQSKLAALLDMGVDCFKTDFGERIPTDACFHDGSDSKKMHNYYTYLYNKCVFDLLEEKQGKGNAVLFARSATAGSQKFPVHWGGDCWSDYESMAQSLRGGLSLGMSGFGFWSHDIGGFEQTSTADVYKRWSAFGLLSSHSRLHGSSSYRVPWAYDEEAIEVVRHFTRLKARLMPYLFQVAIHAAKTGIPCMRSMVLEFTNDKTCHHLDTQYMLGDKLLVAPVFNEEGIAGYYLPKGIWTNYFTGKEYRGGSWVEEKYDYMSLPLLVRANSILAVGAHEDRPDYDYANNVELRIYALHDGIKVCTNVYDMRQNLDLTIVAKRMGNTINIAVETQKLYTIRLVNLHAKEAIGAFLVIEGNDTIVTPDLGTSMIEVKF